MKEIILIAVAGLALLFSGRVYAFDNHDFQVWHNEIQEFKVNDKSRVELDEEARFGDNGGNLFYQHYDAGYSYDINKHFTVGVNYRQVFEKDENNDFRQENRPHLNAIVKCELFGFKFDDRNRFEYRDFYWREDNWRYRNKFTIKPPWKLTKFQIQPYLSDEIFINMISTDRMILNQNRLYGGLGFKLTKDVGADIYYMLQNAKVSGKWYDFNIFGSKLKVAF